MRKIVNAIRYMARSGGGWRMLPNNFSLWQTVYWCFRRFVRLLLFRTIHDVALMIDRERSGRAAQPMAGVIDSQSVKAPAAKKRGYDAGKKVVGRKRHIAVDTDGRLLMVNLTTADIADSAGAQMILHAIRKRWPWIKHLFADGADDRTKLMDKAELENFVIEIVRRIEGEPPASNSCRVAGWSSAPSLDDTLAPPRARLRTAHRRVQGHDPRRHRKPSTQAHIH
jgi:putative transposase